MLEVNYQHITRARRAHATQTIAESRGFTERFARARGSLVFVPLRARDARTRQRRSSKSFRPRKQRSSNKRILAIGLVDWPV